MYPEYSGVPVGTKLPRSPARLFWQLPRVGARGPPAWRAVSALSEEVPASRSSTRACSRLPAFPRQRASPLACRPRRESPARVRTCRAPLPARCGSAPASPPAPAPRPVPAASGASGTSRMPRAARAPRFPPRPMPESTLAAGSRWVARRWLGSCPRPHCAGAAPAPRCCAAPAAAPLLPRYAATASAVRCACSTHAPMAGPAK